MTVRQEINDFIAIVVLMLAIAMLVNTLGFYLMMAGVPQLLVVIFSIVGQLAIHRFARRQINVAHSAIVNGLTYVQDKVIGGFQAVYRGIAGLFGSEAPIAA